MSSRYSSEPRVVRTVPVTFPVKMLTSVQNFRRVDCVPEWKDSIENDGGFPYTGITEDDHDFTNMFTLMCMVTNSR